MTVTESRRQLALANALCGGLTKHISSTILYGWGGEGEKTLQKPWFTSGWLSVSTLRRLQLFPNTGHKESHSKGLTGFWESHWDNVFVVPCSYVLGTFELLTSRLVFHMGLAHAHYIQASHSATLFTGYVAQALCCTIRTCLWRNHVTAHTQEHSTSILLYIL